MLWLTRPILLFRMSRSEENETFVLVVGSRLQNILDLRHNILGLLRRTWYLALVGWFRAKDSYQLLDFIQAPWFLGVSTNSYCLLAC